MSKRDFKVGIKGREEFFDELEKIAGRIDRGEHPSPASERIYFEDARTFFHHITPRRFDLLEELHRSGPISINALAKLLKRNYKNVHDDVKALAQIGLIEKNDEGRYTVPWDEVTATLRLAA
jgi:predicted transcriptional regulator